MRKITLALSAACLLFSLNSAVVARASAPTPLYTGTTAAMLAEQAPIHWVSVAQIENSLMGRAPMAVGFDIDDTVLFSSPGFWRGKKMYSPDSEANLKNPEIWEKMIPAANMNPVIFAGDKEGQNTKIQWLEKKNIKVFYGDSDNDITAAQDAGARGIRVLRASNSTYRPLPMAGKFGEEVIVNSEY